MVQIHPKPYLDRFKFRRKAKGRERRLNMSKEIVEHQTYFPKPVTYEDIDQAFYDWADKVLDIAYDGKKLPTYKLFSNQKISEYSQTWSNLDDTGNLIMNFKTITRETNPQHGENQGASYNIPGHRDYILFKEPVLQENGEEAYDVYYMKQPFAINFIYTLNVIVTKLELLNRFNELINYEFQSINTYISPNSHPMPMEIENINDESEYTIDDRKFYSQSYQIKVMGYIIRKEDYSVERVPSRFIMRFGEFNNSDMKPFNKRKKRDISSMFKSEVKESFASTLTQEMVDEIEISRKANVKCLIDSSELKNKKHVNVILQEDEYKLNDCPRNEDDGRYYNKFLTYEIRFPECELSAKFDMTNDMVITGFTTEKIYDYRLFVNGERINIEEAEEDIRFYKGDNIQIKISRDDLLDETYEESIMILTGYDPTTWYDMEENNTESELDAKGNSETIIIEDNGQNKGTD